MTHQQFTKLACLLLITHDPNFLLYLPFLLASLLHCAMQFPRAYSRHIYGKTSDSHRATPSKNNRAIKRSSESWFPWMGPNHDIFGFVGILKIRRKRSDACSTHEWREALGRSLEPRGKAHRRCTVSCPSINPLFVIFPRATKKSRHQQAPLRSVCTTTTMFTLRLASIKVSQEWSGVMNWGHCLL